MQKGKSLPLSHVYMMSEHFHVCTALSTLHRTHVSGTEPLEEGAVIPILQMSKVRHGLGNVSKVTLQSQDSLNNDTLPLEGIEKEKNLHVCVCI